MTSRVVSRSAAGPRELISQTRAGRHLSRRDHRRDRSTQAVSRRSSGVLVDSPRPMLHRCIAGTPAHLLL
eukprot:6400756-Prymnesium_polylepis.1